MMFKRRILCKLGIHKWKYVKEEYSDTFLGEKIKRYYNKFRICERCKECQQCTYDLMSDYYVRLNTEEKKILFKKIKDVGDYYLLKR